MFVHLLRLLGVTPQIAGKSGKREAAWMAVAIALGVTIYAMMMGADMVREMSPVLLLMWPSAFALLAGAYKLEYDQKKFERTAERPPGYPADIVPPEGWEPPDGRVG